MKLARQLTLIALTALVATSISCSDDGGGGTTPSEGELLLQALEGTYDVPTSGIPSEVAALLSNPQITVSVTDSGASFTPDSSSGLADFIASGSFSVADDGTVSGPTITPATGSGLAFSGPTVAATLTNLTVGFTATAARESGVGSWSFSIGL